MANQQPLEENNPVQIDRINDENILGGVNRQPEISRIKK